MSFLKIRKLTTTLNHFAVFQKLFTIIFVFIVIIFPLQASAIRCSSHFYPVYIKIRNLTPSNIKIVKIYGTRYWDDNKSELHIKNKFIPSMKTKLIADTCVPTRSLYVKKGKTDEYVQYRLQLTKAASKLTALKSKGIKDTSVLATCRFRTTIYWAAGIQPGFDQDSCTGGYNILREKNGYNVVEVMISPPG